MPAAPTLRVRAIFVEEGELQVPACGASVLETEEMPECARFDILNADVSFVREDSPRGGAL